MLEKKAARREAVKARDGSPDLASLPGGGDVMGGDDTFAAAKARYVPHSCHSYQSLPS